MVEPVESAVSSRAYQKGNTPGGGYWVDSQDNPFNQMDYTRGGGGQENRRTQDSNDRRISAMQGAGAAALPRFATFGIAQAHYPGRALAVVGGDVIRTTGPGAPSASTKGGNGGNGAGSPGASTGGGGKGAGSKAAVTPGAPLKVKHKDQATGLYIGGDGWQSHPWFSDAEEYEARYGEPGDWLGGVLTFGADAAWNLGRWVNQAVTPTNQNPLVQPQPRHDSGWVSYDEGATWSFAAKDGTQPFMWDTGGRNPDLNPWR